MNSGGNDFSEQVLARTLDAVRRRRRRKRVVAGGAAAAACAAGLLAVTNWDAPAPSRVAGSPREPATAVPEGPAPAPALTVFRTEDVAPTVRLIDDSALAELLTGRPFAVMTTAGGDRQLWVPES